MTHPEITPAGAETPQSAPAGDGYTGELFYRVEAAVQHHAPCVPECRVCYPVSEGAE